jgi:hypothetical protein
MVKWVGGDSIKGLLCKRGMGDFGKGRGKKLVSSQILGRINRNLSRANENIVGTTKTMVGPSKSAFVEDMCCK